MAVRAAHPRRPPAPQGRHRPRRRRRGPLAVGRPPGPHAGPGLGVEVELTPKPAARTARIMAGLLSQPRYAQVVYLAAPAARHVVTARRGPRCPRRSAGGSRSATCPPPRSCPGGGNARGTPPHPRAAVAAARSVPPAPPPAQRRHPGGAVAGHRRRGRSPRARRGWPAGPPARLFRAAAWSSPVAGVWAGRRRAARPHLAGGRARPRDLWQQASSWLVHGRVLPAVALAAPLAVPAGLAGRRGPCGSTGPRRWRPAPPRARVRPGRFDARQWHRQARSARGRLAAPGPFPLVTVRGTVPAGRGDPRRRPPLDPRPGDPRQRVRPAHGHRRRVRHRQDQPDDPPVGRLDRRDARRRAPGQAPPAAGRAGLQRRPRRPRQGRPDPPRAARRRGRPRRRLARRRHPQPVGAAARRARGAAVPDDRARRRVRRLLRRHHPGRPHAGRDRAARPAGQRRRSSSPGSTPAGWRTPGPATRTGYRRWPPPAPTPATSSCGTRPCCAGSAPPSTAPAAWKTPTPGTSSSKAPVRAVASPRRRRWRSPSWSRTPRPAGGTEPRTILLAADDYSAVSRRVPLSNLYERGRSLGLGVMVSAQSWQGLGADDDERNRIAATADGGIWVMQTPYPQPLCELAGTRRVLESARKLLGQRVGRRGNQPHPARLDRRPRPDPPARHRAGRATSGADRPSFVPDRPPPPLPAAAARRPGRPAHHPAAAPASPRPAGTGATTRRPCPCPPSPPAGRPRRARLTTCSDPPPRREPREPVRRPAPAPGPRA